MRTMALAVLFAGALAAQAQQGDLQVTVTAPNSFATGQQHVLTYTVTNLGPGTVTDAWIYAYREPFQPPIAPAVFEPPCVQTTNLLGVPTYQCTIGTLAPNQSVVFTGRWAPGTEEVTEYWTTVHGTNESTLDDNDFVRTFILTVDSAIPMLSPAALALLAAAVAVAALSFLRSPPAS